MFICLQMQFTEGERQQDGCILFHKFMGFIGFIWGFLVGASILLLWLVNSCILHVWLGENAKPGNGCSM